MDRLQELFRRTVLIYETERLLPLVRRASAYALGRLFRYETYYLYQANSGTYSRRSDIGFMPEVDGLSFRIVHTNEEADALEAEGFQFRRYAGDTRRRLNSGAMAFCVFVGHELASIQWLCTTEQARASLKEPPARVDFSNGEAWAGASWTNPGYRRMGLYKYGSAKTVEYWLQRGIAKSRWAVARSNVASLGADSKAGNVRYGEGRLVRVLWWTWWRERALNEESQCRN